MLNDVDIYISNFNEDTQIKLNILRSFIQNLIAGYEEVISYGIPTYRLNKVNIVHFAGYKTHIGFYPGPDIIEKFKEEIKIYKTSKGTVQFQLNQELPFNLIEKMVKARLENI